MTTIKLNDGKPVLRDGKVGTGQGCCCNGDCLCCSCVERVAYTPSEPGANAQPFAGIAPEGGSWAWDSTNSYYYGDFPCHYVEYAFSEYAAAIFPNAANAGADAAYSGGGTWARSPVDESDGRTVCTGSTEANCQPCLAYPGDSPPGSPLPTLAQLQKQCGVYHPCTPCEFCSVGACTGARVQYLYAGDPGSWTAPYDFPSGEIPWPPPDDTCPCEDCSILCMEEVRTVFWSKPKTTIIDGEHYWCNEGPLDGPPQITTASQPAGTWLVIGDERIGGVANGLGLYGRRCNTYEQLDASYYPIYPDTGWRLDNGTDPCGLSENGTDLSDYICSPGYPVPESVRNELFPWGASYFRLRIVQDCGDCPGTPPSSPGPCGVMPPYADGSVNSCGGMLEIQNGPWPGSVFNLAASWCPLPVGCGRPCWTSGGNPFP